MTARVQLQKALVAGLKGLDTKTNGSRKGEKMCKMTQEVGSQKRKGQMKMWTEHEPCCPQIED
jgi:hypothetical protein